METIPKIPRDIVVPAGTEINSGKHEDGESYFTNGPTNLRILGPQKDGAYPVVILENGKEGQEGQDVFFYHQPVTENKGP